MGVEWPDEVDIACSDCGNVESVILHAHGLDADVRKEDIAAIGWEYRGLDDFLCDECCKEPCEYCGDKDCEDDACCCDDCGEYFCRCVDDNEEPTETPP